LNLGYTLHCVGEEREVCQHDFVVELIEYLAGPPTLFEHMKDTLTDLGMKDKHFAPTASVVQ
jgi:acetoacetate decarboxylase